MAYTKYSLTPANNNAAPPDGAPEGMLPSAVNDTMRDMMAQIRDCGDGIRGGTYTMTAPVITGGSVTVLDTGFTLQDEADPTKQAQFQLSGITTATTRSYTLPNSNATLATISNLAQTFAGNTTFSNATVTVGSSTAASTYGFGSGATISGATKTLNIGTAGVSGSTTAVNIGSAVSGATSTIAINGNVGIGATPTQKLDVFGSDNNNLIISRNSNNTSSLRFQSNAAASYIVSAGSIPLIVDVASTERMRISSAGNLYVGTTSGDEQFIVNCSLANTNAIKFVNTSSTGYGIACVVNNSSSGTYRFFEGVDSGPSQRIAIYTNGDVKNTNNSYGSLSDAKLKQDIVDASSQWDDIKNLKVRKYRFKDNPEGQLQIGLIAQEVEPISAGLVSESPDEERDENGSVIGLTGEYTKSIKYSVLYMKAVKALQEAMERIETLESKVQQLENK
jgi:hypothetical protein